MERGLSLKGLKKGDREVGERKRREHRKEGDADAPCTLQKAIRRDTDAAYALRAIPPKKALRWLSRLHARLKRQESIESNGAFGARQRVSA